MKPTSSIATSALMIVKPYQGEWNTLKFLRRTQHPVIWPLPKVHSHQKTITHPLIEIQQTFDKDFHHSPQLESGDCGSHLFRSQPSHSGSSVASMWGINEEYPDKFVTNFRKTSLFFGTAYDIVPKRLLVKVCLWWFGSCFSARRQHGQQAQIYWTFRRYYSQKNNKRLHISVLPLGFEHRDLGHVHRQSHSILHHQQNLAACQQSARTCNSKHARSWTAGRQFPRSSFQGTAQKWLVNPIQQLCCHQYRNCIFTQTWNPTQVTNTFRTSIWHLQPDSDSAKRCFSRSLEQD